MKSPAPLPPPRQQPETTTHLLEINLISAQNLKQPSTNLRKLQTFAEVFIDASTKLRTRVDRVGSENPNWNDKFIFRVSDEFLSSETSAFTVEIFAVGVVKHTLLGTVRCLLGNFPSPIQIGVHYCVALQVRRPSGRFQGVLNVGVMAIHSSSEVGSSLAGVSAIGYRDFMGDSGGKKNRRRRKHRRNASDMSSGSGSYGGDSVDFSDETESTESNSSIASGPSPGPSPGSGSILRELNGRREREMAGKEGNILCGLGFQKKVQLESPSSPSENVIKSFGALDLESC